MFDFGSTDLSQTLGRDLSAPDTRRHQGAIRPNMAPPANFWEGDTFKIGAPGLQQGQPGPTPPPTPTDPMPQLPMIPGGTQMPPSFIGGAGASLARSLALPPTNTSQIRNQLRDLGSGGGNPFLQQYAAF